MKPEVGRKITFLGVKTLERLGNLGLACMPEGTEGRIVAVREDGAIGALLMTEQGPRRTGLMPGEFRVEPDDPWAPVPFSKLRGGDAFMDFVTGCFFVKLDRKMFKRVDGLLLERNAIDITRGSCVSVKPDKDVFYVAASMVVYRIGGEIEHG